MDEWDEADEYLVERRKRTRISNEDFEGVAARAAEIVETRLYAAVGRTLVAKILRFIGAGLLAIFVWEVARALGFEHDKILRFLGLLAEG